MLVGGGQGLRLNLWKMVDGGHKAVSLVGVVIVLVVKILLAQNVLLVEDELVHCSFFFAGSKFKRPFCLSESKLYYILKN